MLKESIIEDEFITIKFEYRSKKKAENRNLKVPTEDLFAKHHSGKGFSAALCQYGCLHRWGSDKDKCSCSLYHSDSINRPQQVIKWKPLSRKHILAPFLHHEDITAYYINHVAFPVILPSDTKTSYLYRFESEQERTVKSDAIIYFCYHDTASITMRDYINDKSQAIFWNYVKCEKCRARK